MPRKRSQGLKRMRPTRPQDTPGHPLYDVLASTESIKRSIADIGREVDSIADAISMLAANHRLKRLLDEADDALDTFTTAVEDIELDVNK